MRLWFWLRLPERVKQAIWWRLSPSDKARFCVAEVAFLRRRGEVL